MRNWSFTHSRTVRSQSRDDSQSECFGRRFLRRRGKSIQLLPPAHRSKDLWWCELMLWSTGRWESRRNLTSRQSTHLWPTLGMGTLWASLLAVLRAKLLNSISRTLQTIFVKIILETLPFDEYLRDPQTAASSNATGRVECNIFTNLNWKYFRIRVSFYSEKLISSCENRRNVALLKIPKFSQRLGRSIGLYSLSLRAALEKFWAWTHRSTWNSSQTCRGTKFHRKSVSQKWICLITRHIRRIFSLRIQRGSSWSLDGFEVDEWGKVERFLHACSNWKCSGWIL